MLYSCKLMHKPDPDHFHRRADINSQYNIELGFNLKMEMKTLLRIKIFSFLNFLGTYWYF